MARSKEITHTIRSLEKELTKQKAVFQQFNSAKVHITSGFQSKEVNKNYTNFLFDKRSYGLYVVPYCEVNYTFDGEDFVEKVYSTPKTNRLIYVSWNGPNKPYVIRFSRLSINLKNNEFKDDMLNACQTEIMSFIKANPKYDLDTKHLDGRLKKLLAFV